MANTSIMQLPIAIGLDGSEYVPVVQNSTTKRATTSQLSQLAITSAIPASIEFIIDGGGAVIIPQTWGYLTVPFNAEIQNVELLADVQGSIIVDIWKCDYGAFNPPTAPTVANSITGSATPTITNTTKYMDQHLTGWTTTLSQTQVLAFNVPSIVSSISRVTITLNLVRLI